MINQNGIANILVDVSFLETEFQKLGKAQLAAVFTELRLVSSRGFFRTFHIPILIQHANMTDHLHSD